jgi:GAF domain/Sel1 repeat/PilZ domain
MLAFMDRSTLRLPDPDAPRPNRERRRTVRQRLHTPVYVSFNTPQSGAIIDLSELLDLHEHGFAVQTAIPTALSKAKRLEVNRAVTLCLDLPETRQFVHGSGQVMWTDDTGRAGIRFSFLPDRSRQALKEWLFSNLLVASTNHAARINQLMQRRQESGAPELRASEPGRFEPVAYSADSRRLDNRAPLPMADSEQTSLRTEEQIGSISGPPDRAELLSALNDVRRQIREIQGRESEGREDAVLQLITAHAASLTGASGAALALLTRNEDKVICRASVGEPAPPVGSDVDVKTGLSGECLRSGVIVSCADTESDLRVDPEICRLLGIGSFMAAPIFADFRVAGLIEILSPYPRTFAKAHEVILERLAELVPRLESDKGESDREDKGRIEQRTVEDVRAEFELAEAKRTLAGPVIQQTPAQTRPEQAKPQETKHESARSESAIDHLSAAEPNALEAQTPQPERAPEQSLDGLAEYGQPSGRRFPFSHLVLLVLAIAVVAMALGYLLAPAIEQHWLRPAQAAQKPSGPPVAVDARGHALSPTELRTLAEQGDADAQWQLGIVYHEGESVPKDDAMAVQWFERAAEQGYVRAQSTLGAYYWAGRGVPQDFSKAYFWSQLALAQGDKDSKSRLEGLSALMTPSQVARARQQAEVWLHAHNQTANSKSN